MPTMEKSQSKNTCDLVSSLWTLMLIVMFEEYKDDVSFKLWMSVPGGIKIDSTLLLRSSESRLVMTLHLNDVYTCLDNR